MSSNDYKDDISWLMQGDCLERMKEIPDGSVDMVLTDPPYGTTACKWDTVIDLDKMWEQIKRITKPNGAIVLFGSQPFSAALVMSRPDYFAHQWVWNKRFAGNFVQAKRQPLKDHEDVIVFCTSGKQPMYNPQMVDRETPIKKGGNKQSLAIPIAKTENSEMFGKEKKLYDKKHPTTVTSLQFSSRDGRGLHPTQKPVALMEYLIKTHNNENETVVDFTMGSGTTGVAALNLDRKFIGIELDETYFDIAKQRMLETRNL